MTRKLDGASNAETDADGLMHAPAAARNQTAILDAMLPALPASGVVLELASGTGQHIAALAAHRADLNFHPTDVDPVRRIAIDARTRSLPNVGEARALDACAPDWGEGVRADVILLVNLLHLISDAEMAVLLDEVAKAVAPGGLFACYGPFTREGGAMSEGDRAFDDSLRAQDPSIGYKEVAVVESVLEILGFRVERVEMPANNLMLLARKSRVQGL